jgi:methylated-DNA-[protein]-cysteine S-methyltransferase
MTDSEITWMTVPSEIGDLGLVASSEGLAHVVLPRRGSLAAEVRRQFAPLEARRGTGPILALFANDFRLYLSGGRPGFSGPLDLHRATEYERKVYKVARTIPHGETRTYGWVAERAGGSPRSVGNALGRNPLAIVVPCHRVLAANGLGGFSGGLKLKRQLLQLEGAWPLNQVELPFDPGRPARRRSPAGSKQALLGDGDEWR